MLRTRSRDRRLLATLCLSILGLSALVALALHPFRPSLDPAQADLIAWALDPDSAPGPPPSPPDQLPHARPGPPPPGFPSPSTVAQIVSRAADRAAALEEDLPHPWLGPLSHLLDQAGLTGELQKPYFLLAAALEVPPAKLATHPALAGLVALAKDPQPPPHALGCYAHLLDHRLRDPQAALAAFAQEHALYPDHAYALSRTYQLALRLAHAPTLQQLRDDPANAPWLDPHTRLDIAIALRDYPAIFRALAAMELLHLELSRIALALAAAAIWWLIVVSLASPASPRAALWYLLPFAVGLLTSVPTLFFVILQDHIRGWSANGEPLNDLLFYIAGVGFREEFVKLLFVAPFLPALVRRGQEIDALTVGACIGLGFAAQENLSYFQGASGSLAAIPRLITANFVHLALTAIAAQATFQLVSGQRGGPERFFQAFFGVVIAHGLYDFLIGGNPVADAIQIGALITLAVISYVYFQRVHLARPARTSDLAPLAIFLVGASILIGLSYNVFVWEFPSLAPATSLFLLSSTSILPIAFLYIREFRDL
jgi:RsiW-degrading membrane proteinase PrsW (M82 family)